MIMNKMKRFIKDPIFYLCRPGKLIINLINIFFSPYENRKNKKLLDRKLKSIYSQNGKILVQRGPFKGMKYPQFIATGSSLWPKLAGVYEKEIQNLIYKSLEKKYKYIIDIGCAEGYYAVGYARKKVAEKIIAYDIDKNAQRMCKKMCEINNVEIDIRSFCTESTLEKMNFDGYKRSLIIMDCEGYERELLTKRNLFNLGNVDLLIEIHDWLQYDSPTLDFLIELFCKTHQYELVYGIDDYEKAYRYHLNELNEISIKERFEVLKENRERLGEWIYFTERETDNGNSI